MGYSSAKVAAARAKAQLDVRRHHVFTLEVDLAHAAIAQNLLIFAGVCHHVQILVGHSADVLPWLMEQLHGQDEVGLVFLDQRGSRYSVDLGVLESAGVLQDGALVVADNVLKPGAPLFLWQVSQASSPWETEGISLPEFAMTEPRQSTRRYQTGSAC